MNCWLLREDRLTSILRKKTFDEELSSCRRRDLIAVETQISAERGRCRVAGSEWIARQRGQSNSKNAPNNDAFHPRTLPHSRTIPVCSQAWVWKNSLPEIRRNWIASGCPTNDFLCSVRIGGHRALLCLPLFSPSTRQGNAGLRVPNSTKTKAP